MITPKKLQRLDYQKYGDSPTIKSYTNWKLFEENSPLKLPTKAKAGKIEISYHLAFSGSEIFNNLPDGVDIQKGKTLNLSNPEESRILGFHFYALNEPYYIKITKTLKKPLIIVSHLSEEAFTSHHLAIEVKEDVEANLIIYDMGEKGTKSFVVEVKAKNSKLNILTVGKHRALSHYLLRASLGENSEINVTTIVKGGKMSHHREDYSLEGNEAKLFLRGIPVSLNSAIDYITNVLQYGEKSINETKVFGFSYKKGWTVHRGVGKVFDSAKGSLSRVASHILIMDKGSMGVSVPMLEIDTSDIEEASHSATVSQFDEDALFYLRSRGLTKEEALGLFIHGIGEAQVEHLTKDLKKKGLEEILEVIEAFF
jgi:hypothetical protein